MSGWPPSLGRVVLVPALPSLNNGKPVAPAVITGVNSATSVNVRVLNDGNDVPEWRTSLTLVDELPEVEHGKPLPHVWCWPPRV